MKEAYLDKLHSEILLIMDAVDELCTKLGIRYRIAGGTLIGAMRHKGFIPWDDDVDIVMPREDFEKFLKYAETELPEPFKLVWITTNKEYRHLYAKVENKNTIYYEDVKYSIGYPGIFVDIFPLDITKGYSKSLEYRGKLIKKIATMMGMKRHGEIYGVVRNVILRVFSTEFLHSVATRLMKLSNNSDGVYYTNFASTYSVKKATNLKEYYDDGGRILFEDREYCVSRNADAILRAVYGENYMEMPPKSKQKTHCPRYVKFSDGTEMHFEGERKLFKGDFE